MFFEGIKINYVRLIGNGTPVVLLHGWGANSLAMRGVQGYLALRGYDVTAIDFPPFGDSKTPPETWSLDDYARLVLAVADEVGYKTFAIVAHSFGGRVAIRLATKGERITSLVLTGSAGLKKKRSWLASVKRLAFRWTKAHGGDVKRYYSPDYLALDEGMRKVFSRIVATYQDEELCKILCPTLLVWGKHDVETPLYMGKAMHKNIKNSELRLLDGGHFAYAENPLDFNLMVGGFIK